MTFDRIRLISVFALAAFAGCSTGGEDDSPLSEVQLSRTHHLVGMIGPLTLDTFPLVVDDGVFPLAGTLRMTPDDKYSLTGTGSVQLDDRYALENDGSLSLFVARPQQSTLVYGGAYDLAGSTGRYFFTDRVTTRVGLYFGVPLVDGTPAIADYAGDWHMFALHVIYAPDGTLPSIHELGRASAGSVAIDSVGAVTGNVRESVSPAALLPVTGTVTAFQEGVLRASLEFGGTTRKFDGGGSADFAALAQTDQSTDGAGGLCAMMRHRTTPVDLDALAGIYEVGGVTLFLNPGSAGFDATRGTLELNASGAFLLKVRTNDQLDLTYDGSFASADNGGMSFDVSQLVESWIGAVSEDGRTIVFVDHVATAAGGVRTAVRMFVAVRRD